MEKFDIYKQIDKELEDFFETKIPVAPGMVNEDARYLRKKDVGNNYSQWETINMIELVRNSKFRSGVYDEDGQRKIFLNVSNFRADVAKKMVEFDIKDYQFTPEEDYSIWGVWFLKKDFEKWLKSNDYSQLHNEVADDYCYYGTAVVKKIKDKIVRVPLRNLRNTQDVATLNDADYVIEEHVMSLQKLYELAKESGWDYEQIEVDETNFDKEVTFYERYGYVPRWFLEEEGGEEMVKAMAVVAELPSVKNKRKEKKVVLFKEEIDDLPYEEVHYSKREGRWLGIGEIENQFENQLARNVIENLRRKAMIWATKKVFQSADDTLPSSLLKEVKDGQILKITTDRIEPVNMTSQALPDFAQASNIWEQNSNQKSFTFEVATGEALPAGTPFRLGAVLSRAVRSHFALKQEQLGIFFRNLFWNKLFKIFEEQSDKERILSLNTNELEGMAKVIEDYLVEERVRQFLTKGMLPNIEMIRAEVIEELRKKPNIFVKINRDFYKQLKFAVHLQLTSESRNIEAERETLFSLLQLVAANPNMLTDPNLRALLEKIAGLSGVNLSMLLPQSLPQEQMLQSGMSLQPPKPGRRTPTALPGKEETTLEKEIKAVEAKPQL